MKYLPILLAIFLFGCVSGPLPEPNVSVNDTTSDGISSFEECVAAGNPVMESYPRQCRAGGKTFVSLTDLFDVSKDASCEADADCILVDSGLGFRCCWAGACEQIDYTDGKWVAVNKGWFDRQRIEHCPQDCGPAPLCAVRVLNDNYTAVCNGICEKVPIMGQNITANNITDTNQSMAAAPVNESGEPSSDDEGLEAPSGIRFDRYLLVLDDIILPATDDTCGAFSVMEQNGTIVDKLIICEKDSRYWITPDGHKYRILVVKLAAGYTHQEAWADVRIYG